MAQWFRDEFDDDNDDDDDVDDDVCILLRDHQEVNLV